MKIKNKINNKPNLYYLIFLCVFFVVFLYTNIILSNLHWLNLQDDKWFITSVSVYNNIWQFLSARYLQWSSRLFIEYILINLLFLPSYIWAFIHSVVMTLIFYSISNISNTKHILGYIILSVLIFSYAILPDVGLCSVSVNYIWPVACGLFVISVLKEIFVNKKSISLLKKILCFILLFFSCNLELMCIFLLIFIFFIILYISMNNEKIDNSIFIFLSIIIVGLMIHLCCPGNYERIFEEASDYGNAFYKFKELNFLQIFIYGSIGSFLGIKPIFFIELFFILIALCGIKLKNRITFIISIFPILMLVIGQIIVKFFPNFQISLFLNGFFSTTNIINFFLSKDFGALKIISGTLFALFLIFCSIEYVLYKYFDRKIFYYINLILLTSFFVRVLFSWSTSMFTSQIRTFIFINYFMLCLDMLIINSLFINLKIDKYIKFRVSKT